MHFSRLPGDVCCGLYPTLGSNVAEYLMDPVFMSPKLRPDWEVADIQASFQAMNIALMTGFKV